jgi:hypothetical protein
MIIVCAWCKKIMDLGDGKHYGKDNLVSHGICAVCAEIKMKEIENNDSKNLVKENESEK